MEDRQDHLECAEEERHDFEWRSAIPAAATVMPGDGAVSPAIVTKG